MSLIKEKFGRLNAELFYNSFSSNDYYLFASGVESTVTDNTTLSANEFIDKTIFGKKIDPEEVFYMIPNNIWQSGSRYDQYDTFSDMTGKRYFVTVYPENENIGNYNVFVCLNNNRSGISTSKPIYTPETPNQIYYTSDGYVWQFKYQISGADFQLYSVSGYIPITEANSNPSQSQGIQQISVLNPDANYGYVEISGTITSVQIVDSIKRYYLDASGLNELADFYTGQSFYVTKENGVSNLYQILSYRFDTLNNRYYLTLTDQDISNFITIDDSFKITPRIKITGTGSGATAIPILTENRITSVQILNSGSGYERATAEVVNPAYGFITEGPVVTGFRAQLGVVVTPSFSNIADEFNSRTVLIFNENTLIDNNTIPTTNTYSKIGLVKTPEFRILETPDRFDNRIKIRTETTDQLSVGQVLFQLVDNEITFSSKIHELSNTEIWLYDFNNDFANYANGDFSLNPSIPLRTNTGSIVLIDTDDLLQPIVDYPPYIQRTGEILYINTFGEVERTETSNEKYKILLQF